MGAATESFRLFLCARCRRHVRICTSCDHGNRYCPPPRHCARMARRSSARAAEHRYRRTPNGRRNNNRRQKGFRLRRTESAAPQVTVTHQGSSEPLPLREQPSPTVPPPAPVPASEPPVGAAVRRGTGVRHKEEYRCAVCGRLLSPFSRSGPLVPMRRRHRRWRAREGP